MGSIHNWACTLILLTSISALLTPISGEDEQFSEANFVNVRKIPLMRRKVSLKQKDIGPAANHTGACRLDIFAACRAPIYASDESKSIYERSDELLRLLTSIKNMWKAGVKAMPNATCWPNETFTYADVCGSNHFMICVPNPSTPMDKVYGCCKCAGETAGGMNPNPNATEADAMPSDMFQEYKDMKYAEIGIDPNPLAFPPRNMPNFHRMIRECRQTKEGTLCNPKAYLLCDMTMTCGRDEITKKDYRCRCKKIPNLQNPDPKHFSYIEKGKKIQDAFKIPKNDCMAQSRYRAREWQ